MSAEGFPGEIRLATGLRGQETLAGLLVGVVRVAHEVGFFETLVDGLGLKLKVVTYSHRQKLETLVAGLVQGTRHIADIQTRLVPDTAAAGVFNLTRFPDQSQVNTFLRAMQPAQVQHLERAHQRLLAAYSRAGDRRLWWRLPTGQRLLPVDLDQTYLTTRSTRAERATGGYFGRKRGHHGYKKSLALLGGGVREVLWQRLEAGDTHGTTAVLPMLEALAHLRAARGLHPGDILVRGDSQYGSTSTLRALQAAGHHYLLSGYTPRTAQALAARCPTDGQWHLRGTDSNDATVWYADLGQQTLRGHDDPADQPPIDTRVVLIVRVAWRERKKRGRGAPGTVRVRHVSFEHYVTDLPDTVLPAGALLDAYNDRETEESFFRAEQDAFGAQYLRTHAFNGQAAFLWILVSTVNLLRWTQHRLFANTPLEHLGLTRLVTQALRLPATLIRTDDAWLVILPASARLAQLLVAAWLQCALQLPLPGFDDSLVDHL